MRYAQFQPQNLLFTSANSDLVMKVLGIETSCDETGVAIVDEQCQVLAEQLYSQIDVHAGYGGVVPELASRDHVRKLIPLIRRCLDKAQITLKDLDAIAYTAGPGLIGALFVGASVGQALAWALHKPSIAIHHMEAHLLVPFLDSSQGVEFPFLCLLVSGGHTLLVHAHALGNYQVLGESRDDAVGEAFDKVAQQLGLGYPGGPAIEQLASTSQNRLSPFPRPMLDHPSLDFSFSGLKTHTLLCYQNSNQTTTDKADIACAFQDAVITTLYKKCRRALEHTGLKTLIVAGGVSANQQLRKAFSQFVTNNTKVMFPDLQRCTDNGVMVAYAGMLRALQNKTEHKVEIVVYPRKQLSQIEI